MSFGLLAAYLTAALVLQPHAQPPVAPVANAMNSVVFASGTTIQSSSIPASVGNSSEAFVSFWYKAQPDANDYAVDMQIAPPPNGQNPMVEVRILNGQIGVVTFNAGTSQSYNSSPIAAPQDGNWHNLRASIALPSLMTVCIDTQPCTAFNPEQFPATAPTFMVFGGNAVSLYSGSGASVAEFFLQPGAAPDPSMSGVGASFVATCSACASGVIALDLGPTGATPLGVEPMLYVRGYDFINQATGASFDVDGAPAESTYTFSVVNGSLALDTTDPFNPGAW